MTGTTVDINYASEPVLPLGKDVVTDSVVPTLGTAYKRGDLLVISEDNVATHSTTGKDWHVICNQTLTAEQVNKKLSKGEEMPVIVAGKIDVDTVTLNSQLLSEEQKKQARAYSYRSLTVKLSYTVGGV